MIQDKKNLLFPNTFASLLAGCICLFLLSGCQPNGNQGTKDGNSRFRTNDPSVLYFKNIRSLKYQTFRDPTTQLDYYHPKIFSKKTKTTEPKIWPVLIHNWLQDEVYLNMGTRNLPTEVVLAKMSKDSSMQIIGWPKEDNLSQFEFLMQLQRYIQDGSNLVFQSPKTAKIRLLYAPQERVALATTIQDFLDLTKTRDNN